MVATARARRSQSGFAGGQQLVLRCRGVRKAGHPHRHAEAQLLPLQHDDLRRALAAQSLHPGVRSRQAHTGQQHTEQALTKPARGIHRARIAAQQPAHGFKNARRGGRSQLLRVAGERIDLDQHQSELAMLARRQVDFAPQLVFELRSRVQPGGLVAHALVSQFQAQRFVGTLLLLELLQGGAKLRLLVPCGASVDPDAAQPALAARADTHRSLHGKVMPSPGPFEAQLTAGRLGLGQHRLLGGTPTGRQQRLDQVGIGASQHGLGRTAEERRHRVVRVDVAATGHFLDRQQRTLAGQPGIERVGKQQRQILGRLVVEVAGQVALR